MVDYYETLHLKRTWSNWRLVKKLEKKIRADINSQQDITTAFTAFRIFLSDESRKIYDLNLKAGDNKLRSWRFISGYIEETSQFLEEDNFSLIFSGEGFLKTHYEEILNRMFGLDFLFQGLGQRKTSGEIKELSAKTTQAVFRSYFYFYYGIPMLLGYFFNPWFYLLFIPLVLVKFLIEYRRVKLEFYWLRFGPYQYKN